MEQILDNLVSNAIKYSDGRPIEVRARILGDTVGIVVDHGPGIAAADRAFSAALNEWSEPRRTAAASALDCGS